MQSLEVDKLQVEIYDSRQEAGEAAAASAAAYLKLILKTKERVDTIFAAAPSQSEFLENLIKIPEINWAKVRAFHLDEYIGLPDRAPQSFRNFLNNALWGRVNFGKVETIRGESPDPAGECLRYAALLQKASLELACIGIGENGHVAFNEPHLARFDDPEAVKIVDLDLASRQQQVNDGCFEKLNEVPTGAITVTIPVIMSSKKIICVVPGPQKAAAVYTALRGPIQPDCPASILRRHPNATMFLDRASASRLI